MRKYLWAPDARRVATANITHFKEFLAARENQTFVNYGELHEWSVSEIDRFWEAVWEYAEIIHSKKHETVLDAPDGVWKPKWFVGAKLNFAENLLRFRDDREAIVSYSESRDPVRISYEELYRQVARCAEGLKALGVTKNDRVAAVLPNIAETIIAMLAATSIGAIWSSCSPDFGFQGIMDRFEQIEPSVLLTCDGYTYGGKQFPTLDNARRIVDTIDSIEHLVVVPMLSRSPDMRDNETAWTDLLANDSREVAFVQTDFDHPVYIMYSSGTTGKPKCMVHGGGRVLLQHYKELVLHSDLNRDDTITYFTTCGWMMWNWLVSSLMTGATVLVYDGSPVHPGVSVLWQLIDKEDISIFGTSPKFLSTCESRRYTPRDECSLTSLKTILSTGSPLSVQNFTWVYEHVKSDLHLASISGGTDLVSCFMLGNPTLPVYPGQIQGPGLGMKVEVYDDIGNPMRSGVGELVCTAPFPTEPLEFWNDPDDEKYQQAYFSHFEGVWRHGDFIEFTEEHGIIVHGRSDATLNPGGVRIGTAEIYGPVESMDEITDSIVVGQKYNDDVRVVLFVVLRNGTRLDDELRERIKVRLRDRTTPRHVPARIIQVDDIPHTINGKKVELAVTRTIHGEPVTNRDALANPESLKQFEDVSELQA